MHVTLVIGATGILRPATETLLTAGTNVVGVGRDPDRFAALREGSIDALGKLVELPHDAAAASFGEALSTLVADEGLVVDDVVAYAPATSVEVLTTVTEAGRLPTVEIVTSSAAQPKGSDDDPWTVAALPSRPWRRLVLGWTYDSTDQPRWHTAEEISTAALSARDEAADRILGAVRPWADRPS